MNHLFLTIKQTSIGGALAWLMRPMKHRRDVQHELEQRLAYPPTRQQVRWCFWDYFRFRLRYRGELDIDYFGAQLYRKSDLVRRESLAHGARHAWRDAVQAPQHRAVFLDKSEFYRAFSEHLHRNWLLVDQNADRSVFDSFIKDCNGLVFCKPVIGQGGKGIALMRLAAQQDQDALFQCCKQHPHILEEPLQECAEIRDFSDGAANTLRIITLIDERGQAHVARCELRMARKGMDIDNYSSGGLVAQVDVSTGVIFSMGADHTGKSHIFHPDSGKQIVGFTIPDWDGYKTFACTLAQKFPDIRYVGWDIIKNDAGEFCVIEGNKDAGVGGLESGLLYGLRPHFESLLNTGMELSS